MKRVVGALVTCVLLAVASGCSLFEDEPEAETPSASSTPSVPVLDPAPDVIGGLNSALARRAAALLRGDAKPVLAGLARGDVALREQQQTYVDNLRQLPLALLAYELRPDTLVRVGDDYRVEVSESLQLDGFDTAPVVRVRRFGFTPGGKPGRFLLAAVTDPEWEAEHPGNNQPWDLGRITVSREGPVLGVFDDATARFARRVLDSTNRGIEAVAAVVPSAWNRTAVVYAEADQTYLAALAGVPGGDASALDAFAVPTYATPDGELVATRIVLSPGLLSQPGRTRDRLVRHELTHAAVGDMDDGVPLWLSEGIAEYVSVQILPQKRRSISPAAVEAAEIGVLEMPADDAFDDVATPGRASVNYGVAWFACEYLAATYGEITLWQLLDAMGREDADPDDALLTIVGLNARTLARKAGKLIATTYAPEPDPAESESPSAEPSSDASPSESPSATSTPSSTPTGTPSP